MVIVSSLFPPCFPLLLLVIVVIVVVVVVVVAAHPLPWAPGFRMGRRCSDVSSGAV